MDHGADEYGSRIHVQLCVLAGDTRDAQPEADDDGEVPEHRCQGGDTEVVVRVEDPDDDATEPEQYDDREEDTREADGQIDVAARIAERPHQNRGNEDEQSREPAEREEHEPEDRRGDAPSSLPLALLEQVAEDGNERSGESSVGEERPYEVRDLEGDGEGVDLPVDPEVVRGDHLADETEHPGDTRGQREEKRRAGELPL